MTSNIQTSADQRTPRRLVSFLILTAILVSGIAVRLALAPDPGDPKDIPILTKWMQSATVQGVVNAYKEKSPAHGPVQLGMYAIAGHAYQFFVSPTFSTVQPTLTVFTKLPAIAADAVIIVLLFFLLSKKWNRKIGMIGALLYAFNPASLVVSGIWGQTDSIYTAFILAAILAASFSQWMLCGFIAATALLCKPTALIITIPLLIPLALANYERFLRMLSGALLALLIVAIFFWLQDGIVTLKQYFLFSYAQMPYEVKTALNVPWLLQDLNHKILPALPFGLEYRTAGLGISSIILLVLLWSGRRLYGSCIGLCMLATIPQFTLFIFLEGMRSRYHFPLIVFALPFCFVSLEGLILYLLISGTMFLNLISKVSNAVSDSRLIHPILSIVSSLHNYNRYIALLQILLYCWTLFFVFRMRNKLAVSRTTDGVTSAWDLLTSTARKFFLLEENGKSRREISFPLEI